MGWLHGLIMEDVVQDLRPGLGRKAGQMIHDFSLWSDLRNQPRMGIDDWGSQLIFMSIYLP